MTVALAPQLESAAARRELGLDDLRELMRHVTDTTLSLQQTHDALQQQVVRLKEELAEANRQLTRSRQLAALGEMAAGIAHEIRNPLASIQLYVQALGEDLADRPEQQELCRKVGNAVTGVEAIIRDVLAFSRETRTTPLDTTAGVIVQRTLESCAALLESGCWNVQLEVDEAAPVFADAVLLVQALGNIVRNAIEAMSETLDMSGLLCISAAVRTVRCPDGERRRRTVFTVRDSGPGIAPEVIERMFNPFFTTRAAGTGLGLAIVHRIIDAHSGHINVKNVRDVDLGSGAMIELCIPCCALDARQAVSSDSPRRMAQFKGDPNDSGTLLPQDAA